MSSHHVVQYDTRLFESDGEYLTRIPNVYLKEFTTIFLIGEPVLRIYDHKEQLVYPIEIGDKTYFIIAEEAGIEPTLH